MSFQSINDLYKKYDTAQNKKQYKKPNEVIVYTTIFHNARVRLGLSVIEYIIADYIAKVGSYTQSREIGGFVFTTRETIAKNFDIGKRTTIRAINELIKKGLVEKNERNFLRTTDEWQNEVMFEKNKFKKP